MEDIPSNYPTPYETIWVTYEKTITFGAYNMESRKEIVTERGFYCKLFKNFSIPPDWQYFRMGNEECLLPHGFGGGRLTIDKVISWKPIENKSSTKN